MAHELHVGPYTEENVNYGFLSERSATDDPEADASMIEKLYQEQHFSKYYQEREWFLNQAFFHGKHWVAWNRVTNKVEEVPKAKRGEVRTTTNLIFPRVISLQAKFSGSKLIPYVIPRTNSEENRDHARVSMKVLKYLMEDLGYDRKRRDLAFNVVLLGTCFLKLYLDQVPHEYEFVPVVDDTGQLVLDSKGEPKVEERPKVKIGLDVVTPFDILVDPSATDMTNIRWIMHIKTRSVEYVKERFPNAAKHIKADIDNRVAKDFSDRIKSMSDSEGVYATTRLDLDKNVATVTLKEYWEPPSKKWIYGRILTSASGILLKAVENPFGRIPFFAFYFNKNPMRFWGSTPITHIIPINREYNRRRSLIQESILKMGKMKWLAPKGAGIQDYAIDTEIGEIIEFNPIAGMVPTQAQLQNIPPYILQDQQTLAQEMDLVLNMSPTMRPGGMPKNVRTASAASMMQEMEQMQIMPTLEQHNETHETVLSEVLKLFEEFMLGPQEISIYDHESDEVESLTTSGSEIKGNTNVTIQGAGEFPQSRTIKRMEIMQYYQMGLLGNPGDDKTRKRVLRLLEFGDMAQVFDDNSEEESLIIDENDMMERGDQPQVKEYNDHMLHIELHDKVLKSEGLKMDPEVEQRFLIHRRQHGKAMEQLMNAMSGTMQQGMSGMHQRKRPQQGGKGSPQSQGPRGTAAPQPSGVMSGQGQGRMM